MSENIRPRWDVSRVSGDTLDLLEDGETRVMTLSILQCSIIRQMVFPWAKLATRLVNEHPDYWEIVEMPQEYKDALEELELLVGGGYVPPEEEPVGEIFVDRGDPANWDTVIGNLTVDGNWHELSLAGWVTDDDATRVLLFCRFYQASGFGGRVSFRRDEMSYAFNMAENRTHVAGYYDFLNCEVQMGSGRDIEYRIDVGMTECSIVVRGWWKPAG